MPPEHDEFDKQVMQFHRNGDIPGLFALCDRSLPDPSASDQGSLRMRLEVLMHKHWALEELGLRHQALVVVEEMAATADLVPDLGDYDRCYFLSTLVESRLRVGAIDRAEIAIRRMLAICDDRQNRKGIFNTFSSGWYGISADGDEMLRRVLAEE